MDYVWVISVERFDCEAAGFRARGVSAYRGWCVQATLRHARIIHFFFMYFVFFFDATPTSPYCKLSDRVGGGWRNLYIPHTTMFTGV